MDARKGGIPRPPTGFNSNQPVMQKVARSIRAKVFVGGKLVNCEGNRLLSTLSIRSPSSNKHAFLQPSSVFPNYEHAQSTFASYKTIECSTSLQDSNKQNAIALDDFLSQHASTSSDILAGQEDTFNAALAAGKFELRFLLPTDRLKQLSDEYIEEMQKNIGVEIFKSDFGKPDSVLVVVCLQQDVRVSMEHVLPKITNKTSHIDFLLHKFNTLRIKGFAGARIKKTLKEFDLDKEDVKVFSQCCPSSTDAIFRLKGSLDKLPRLIEKFTSSLVPIHGLQHPFNSMSYDSEIEAMCAKSKPKPRLSYRQGVSLHGVLGGEPLKISFPIEVLPVISGEGRANIHRIRLLSSAMLFIGKPSEGEKTAKLEVRAPFPHQLQYLACLLRRSLEETDVGKAYLSHGHKEFSG